MYEYYRRPNLSIVGFYQYISCGSLKREAASHYSCTFQERGPGHADRKRSRLEDGQASVNASGHLLQTSQRQTTGEAQIEITGAAMQRAIGTPGLDGLPLAPFAGGRKAAIDSLEGEGGQGRKPVKPLGGIRDQGKHSPGGTNGQVAAVGPIFDQRKSTRTRARLRTCGIGGRCRGRGRGGRRGRWQSCLWRHDAFFPAPLTLTQESQSQLRDLLLERGHLGLQLG